MSDDFQADIAAIGRIAAIPTILDVVCRVTGMGFAAVARVTADRWIACGTLDAIDFGLAPGGELKVETTICHEIEQSHEPVIINHVAEDEVYCGHPTPKMYGFQSYISIPIILEDGSFFGTLCAIDPRPARLDTPEIIGMFRLFAQLIASQFTKTVQLSAAQSRLREERETSALREEFIAVLGHDLRNPLLAITSGMDLLKRTPLNEKAAHIVGLVQNSVARMASLIDNVLDFARGRLGGGLSLERGAVLIEPVLNEIVAEMQVAWPDRIFDTKFVVPTAIDCDSRRIGQLLSNLLGNAVTYAKIDEPIRAGAACIDGVFELFVANSGDPIPAAIFDKMFQPFTRGAVRPSQQGLGLGLYICAEVARAHGGGMTIASTDEETRFTFRMPLVS